jgi:Zn-dependent protease
MLGQAGHTNLDVRFQMFGIPVRIHPIFWVSSAFLVWDRDDPRMIFPGIMCVLVSVLVHELGHAILSRRYGYPSEIVLFFLGGYATSSHFSTWKNVRVSLAGPAAGFALFLLTYFSFVYVSRRHPQVLLEYPVVTECFFNLLFMNLMWNVINLIPTLPLDGGQIMQALMLRYGAPRAQQKVMRVSTGAAAFATIWFFLCWRDREFRFNPIPIPDWLLPGLRVDAIQPHGAMLVIFFALLAAQSYNAMQNSRY